MASTSKAAPETRRVKTDALRAVAEVASQLGELERDPPRAALFLRGVRALAKVTRSLTPKQVERVFREEDFLTALQETTQASQQRVDPLAAARLRAARLQRELLDQEGGPLGVEQVAELLGISRQAVAQRRAQKKLLAVQLGTRAWQYPSWQFAGAGVLAGVEASLGALDAATPWDALRFFLTKSPLLRGRRPLDELRKGGAEKVVAAARAFDQQGNL